MAKDWKGIQTKLNEFKIESEVEGKGKSNGESDIEFAVESEVESDVEPSFCIRYKTTRRGEWEVTVHENT